MVFQRSRAQAFRPCSIANLAAFSMILVAATSLSGCGKEKQKPLSEEERAKPIATNVLVTPLESLKAKEFPSGKQVQAELTLRRDLVLDREFLYGFDLQYSSGSDARLALIPQSQALGHVPAAFRLIGDRLQLLADQSRLFESDINHPELLINEYRVIRSDAETITVILDRPGQLVHMTMNGPSGPEVKLSWLRSFEYVAQGNYLLQETALLLADGQVQTFMESIFPRDTLVPSDYKGLESTPSVNPLAERYRFLDNEKVYVDRSGLIRKTREKTSFANRFHIKAGETIDWYVTQNAPADFMNELKSGVEGWNRYFIPQMGYAVMQFKGYLPNGVKLGDPRYNVINYDSVAQAGAAYESQASDPLTGIQSHSLIYMPYAWYNIARGLYSKRHPEWQPASENALRSTMEPRGSAALFGRERRILNCMRSTDEALVSFEQPVDHAGEVALDNFGRRVFIATLFHEVGHALGLAHNFKGSMAFDANKPAGDDNRPTWSVMDYNYYQHEVDLFSKPGASDGPSQEYDRQIISQLYHDGKDVAATDLKVPACNDEEADSTDGGVDPVCTRYDSESNPITALQHAFDKVVLPSGAKGIEALTLTEAITALEKRLEARLYDTVATKNAVDVKALTPTAASSTANLVAYYVSEGAQSLRVNLVNNAKALRKWRIGPEGLPTGMDENTFRATFAQVLSQALALDQLPDPAAAAAVSLSAGVRQAIEAQERFGATKEDRVALADSMVKAIEEKIAVQVGTSFGKMRALVFGTLRFNSATPFSTARLTPLPATPEIQSIEDTVFGFFKKNLLRGVFGSKPDQLVMHSSRLAAAAGLASFRGTGEYDLTPSNQQLLDELTKAKLAGSQDAIEQIRGILVAMKSGS